MNILYLNNYNYTRGGAEKVFLEEAALLRRYGNSVYLFARKHPKNTSTEYDEYFPQPMVTDKLRLSRDSLRSVFRLFYAVDAKKCLEKMLHNFDLDVAHVHNIYGRITTSALDLLYSRNIPVIMTLHDYKLICPSYKLLYDNGICEACKNGAYYNAIRKRCHKGSYIASALYAGESYSTMFSTSTEKTSRFLPLRVVF